MKKETIEKDFKDYLEEHKGEPIEDVINDFFSNIFYDIQDEEDLEEVNLAEEKIRKEAGLV